jgi:thiamine-monophosphate kinase
VNLSDLAAMAASPRFALVSLAVSATLDAGWIMELYGGMLDISRENALALVGGDLSRGALAVISVSVVGEVARGRAVLRSGARPAERLVVTGSLGASAAGLALLRARAGRHREQILSLWGRERMEAHFRPVARVGEGQTLAQAGATAMMDVSDGLALDLARLCTASGVGCRLRLSDVPIATSAVEVGSLLRVAPLDLALSGGEDYELLATLPRDAVAEARRLLDERFGVLLTEVGEIVESGMVAVDPDGTERPLEPKGWDHFARH